MSIEIIPRILVLVCVAIAVLGLFIGTLIYQISRKKGRVGILLAVLFTIITGYYCYLFFFPLFTYTAKQNHQPFPPLAVTPGQLPVMVVFETEDGTRLTAEDGDYLEINRNLKIKVAKVMRNNAPVENVRVNVIGFTPYNNPSAIDDTGYTFSYRDMRKNFATDQEKNVFVAEVKRDDEKIGEVFLKFIK
ncbi:MAG: hypothetical protein NC907_06160 [Candidatus Omnitrophica bacterium]|nr:hypothetical protein [Candidatus Omnitrophota bacterium]